MYKVTNKRLTSPQAINKPTNRPTPKSARGNNPEKKLEQKLKQNSEILSEILKRKEKLKVDKSVLEECINLQQFGSKSDSLVKDISQRKRNIQRETSKIQRLEQLLQ